LENRKYYWIDGYTTLHHVPNWREYLNERPELISYMKTHQVEYGDSKFGVWIYTGLKVKSHARKDETLPLFLSIDGKIIQLGAPDSLNQIANHKEIIKDVFRNHN
jgi:hypothetical protein